MLTIQSLIYANQDTIALQVLEFNILAILASTSPFQVRRVVPNVPRVNIVTKATPQLSRTVLLAPTVLLEQDMEQSSSVLKAPILTLQEMTLRPTVSPVL